MPTRELEKRYATDYFRADLTGDGIPELHLRTSREYERIRNEVDWIMYCEAEYIDGKTDNGNL